jgi:chromosomal replication initiator protein
VVDRVFSIPLVADLPLADADSGSISLAAEPRSAPPSANRASSGDRARSGDRASCEFLAGPENRLLGVAVAALLDENEPRYNPLVIYGPPGTGKSHIARGLAAKRMLRNGSAGEVVFTTGADFARLLHEAIEGRTTARFRSRFRGASLFILDELTQLATKRVAQQELIHTLEAIIAAGGQVVIASRTAPEQMSALAAGLRGRLSAGLAVSLAPPAAAARLALVERFAALRRIAIPESAARTLADGLSATAPELSGALAELQMQAEVEQTSIDVKRVRRFLAERQVRLRPSLRTIAGLSAKYFCLRISDLTSASRRRAVVQARAIAVFLARQLTGKSLEQIGAYFGGRDHTTVLHSFRSIEARVRTDPTTRRAVSDIRKRIASA